MGRARAVGGVSLTDRYQTRPSTHLLELVKALGLVNRYNRVRIRYRL